MSAAPYDIEIEQHAGFDKILFYRDSAGTPVPMAGVSADMHIRLSNGDLLATLTTENGGIVLGATDGSIKLSMSAAQTGAMKFNKARYDLRLRYPGKEPIRLLMGDVTLSKGETR